MTDRGQISIEYLIVVGFIAFIVLVVVGMALYYSSTIQDTINSNEVSDYGNKIVSAAESVYYSGQPSKLTLSTYLPQQVSAVTIINDTLVVGYTTRAGTARLGFTSNVPISGTLTARPGVHRISLVAQANGVLISEG
jgi:hypothetical protein